MEEHTEGKRLIAGTNCYFNYAKWEEYKRLQQSLNRPPVPPFEQFLPQSPVPHSAEKLEQKPSAKKKKKKKKKTASAVPAADADADAASNGNGPDHTANSTAPKFSVGDVSFVDPDADYPESRVIKVGPDGDLIVESLDDEYPRQPEEKNTRRMVPPVPSIPGMLAHKILGFNDEKKRFWNELSVKAQKELFTIDANAITESMHQQQRELASRNIQADGGPGHEHSWAQNSKCYCSRCERNDLHIVNIIDEGFDMYMDELMEGLWEHFELQYHDLKPETKFIDVASAENVLQDKYIEVENMQRFAEIEQIESAGVNAREMASTVRNLELFYYIENILIPMIQREFTSMARPTPLSAEERRIQVDTLSCVHQILRLIQSRNDRNRLLRDTKGVGVRPLTNKEFQRMAVAENLIDCLYDFSKEKLPGIPKAIEFVKILSSVGRAGNHQFPDVTEQMSKFAEMFHNSDGKSFIDIVAKLKASETGENLDEGEDEEDPELEHYALKNPFSHCKCDFHTQLSEKFESARSKALNQDFNHTDEDEEDEDECDIDEDHDCEHDHLDDDEHDIDDPLDDPETDEEEAEERRFKELRGFFFMEARKIIVNRFEESYKKRVSEDRTKKFIEELEAEENAKKEKELKRLKQKEKQKEKKRLQQLEKEEKRKQKEAEEEEKAAIIRRKQEELRAEQKRREEEIKMKKEREKMKKIEALKQKEALSLENKIKHEKREAETPSPVKAKLAENSAAVQDKKKNVSEKEKVSEKQKDKVPEKVPEKAKVPEKQIVSEKAPEKVPEKVSEKVSEKEKEKVSEKEKEKEKPVKSPQTKLPQAKAKSSPETKSKEGSTKKAQVSAEDRSKVGSSKKTPVVSVGQNSSEKTTPIKDVTPAASTSLTGSEKAATSALLDFEVDPHQLVFSTEEIKRSSQDADAGASLFPPKNHLLEQLYHARPRTVSTTSGDSPDFFNEPGSASRMGTGYSPSKKSVSAYQTDSWNPGNPNPFSTDSIIPPSLERPPYLNNAPGNASTWAPRNSQDAFNAPSLTSPLMSNLTASTMWSPNYPSRGNSIWGSTNLTNPEPQTTNLWGPQTSQNDPIKTGAPAVNTKEIVQSAAFKAIQEIRSSKEASLGLSPAMRIFQAAKVILNDPTLKMSEFLSALHSSTKYQFEIIYDDFGSVTDINANIQPERIFGTSSTANRSPSPQQAHAPPLFHAQPPFTQLDHGLKFPGFAPNSMPMNQPLGQPKFQPGMNQDPFQPTNGVFQPQMPMNPHFTSNGGIPSQQIPGPESIGFPPGPFRGSSENVNQFDSKISETMQGSLNQLGIGQVRSGIW